MKKIIFYTLLLFAGNKAYSQKPTVPQLQGYTTARTMNVRGFPFTIKGVPFSQLPGSEWGPQSLVVAELYITYYMESDNTQYGNRTYKNVRVREGGSWEISGLEVLPHANHRVPGKKMVAGKTVYSLFVYQKYNGRESDRWNAIINLMAPLKMEKFPDQKTPPVKVHPKDKHSLNPQPIPPGKLK